MITQLIVLLLTLITTHAAEENCKDEHTKSNDNFMVLVLILGTIYILNHHKVGQNLYEEEEESSDEDESDNDEEEEETDNSEEEMEDESDDDDSGDNGHPSEEEGDEEEEEIESDVESEPVTRKRRSTRLGGKSMGFAAQE